MKIIVDQSKLTGPYDTRNLAGCRCGKHWYPSKKIFVEFLKQYPDLPGTAEIWSESDWETGITAIHVEVKYKVRNLKETKRRNALNAVEKC